MMEEITWKKHRERDPSLSVRSIVAAAFYTCSSANWNLSVPIAVQKTFSPSHGLLIVIRERNCRDEREDGSIAHQQQIHKGKRKCIDGTEKEIPIPFRASLFS